MKVKVTKQYVVVTIQGIEYFYDRHKVDAKGFLEYDGWGSPTDGFITVRKEEIKP